MAGGKIPAETSVLSSKPSLVPWRLVRHLRGLPQPLDVQTVALGPLGWSPGAVTAASRGLTGEDLPSCWDFPPQEMGSPAVHKMVGTPNAQQS